MESILLIILIGLAGGIAVGLQSPMASIITQRLGIFESVFIVHMGGALIALIPMLIYGSKLTQWRSRAVVYTWRGDIWFDRDCGDQLYDSACGSGGIHYTVVAGQLLVGTILDQYGWLGAAVRPLDLTRLIGMAVVLFGVWLTVK